MEPQENLNEPRHTKEEDWHSRFKNNTEDVTERAEKNAGADDDADKLQNDDREAPVLKDPNYSESNSKHKI